MSKKLTARLSLLTLAFVIMIAFVLAWTYAPAVGTASAADRQASSGMNSYTYQTVREIDVLQGSGNLGDYDTVYLQVERGFVPYNFYEGGAYQFSNYGNVKASLPWKIYEEWTCENEETGAIKNRIQVGYFHRTGSNTFDDSGEAESLTLGQYGLVFYTGTPGNNDWTTPDYFDAMAVVWFDVYENEGPIRLYQNISTYDFTYRSYDAKGLTEIFFNDTYVSGSSLAWLDDSYTGDLTVQLYANGGVDLIDEYDGSTHTVGDNVYLDAGDYRFHLDWTGDGVVDAGEDDIDFTITQMTLSKDCAGSLTQSWGSIMMPEPDGLMGLGSIGVGLQWYYNDGGDWKDLTSTLSLGDHDVYGALTCTANPELLDNFVLDLHVGGTPITESNPATLTVQKATIPEYTWYEGFNAAMITYGDDMEFESGGCFYTPDDISWYIPYDADCRLGWFYDEGSEEQFTSATPARLGSGYSIYPKLYGEDAGNFDYSFLFQPMMDSANTFDAGDIYVEVQPATAAVSFFFEDGTELENKFYPMDTPEDTDLYWTPEGFSIYVEGGDFTITGWTESIDTEHGNLGSAVDLTSTPLGTVTGKTYYAIVASASGNYSVTGESVLKVNVKQRIFEIIPVATAPYNGHEVTPDWTYAFHNVGGGVYTMNPGETMASFRDSFVKTVVFEEYRSFPSFSAKTAKGDEGVYAVQLQEEGGWDDNCLVYNTNIPGNSFYQSWNYTVVSGIPTIELNYVEDWQYREVISDYKDKFNFTITTNDPDDFPADQLDLGSVVVKWWDSDGSEWVDFATRYPTADELPEAGTNAFEVRVFTPASSSGNYAAYESDIIGVDVVKAKVYIRTSDSPVYDSAEKTPAPESYSYYIYQPDNADYLYRVQDPNFQTFWTTSDDYAQNGVTYYTKSGSVYSVASVSAGDYLEPMMYYESAWLDIVVFEPGHMPPQASDAGEYALDGKINMAMDARFRTISENYELVIDEGAKFIIRKATAITGDIDNTESTYGDMPEFIIPHLAGELTGAIKPGENANEVWESFKLYYSDQNGLPIDSDQWIDNSVTPFPQFSDAKDYYLMYVYTFANYTDAIVRSTHTVNPRTVSITWYESEAQYNAYLEAFAADPMSAVNPGVYNPADLTVQCGTYTYDGTAQQPIAVFGNLVNGDTLDPTYYYTYFNGNDFVNAASYMKIAATHRKIITMLNDDNYKLRDDYAGMGVKYVINKRTVTLDYYFDDAVVANNSLQITYDNADHAVDHVSITNIAGGDTVSVAVSGEGNIGKLVSATPSVTLTLTGADAANYQFSNTSNTIDVNWTIVKRDIAFTIGDDSMTYGGTASFSDLITVWSGGLAAGDALNDVAFIYTANGSGSYTISGATSVGRYYLIPSTYECAKAANYNITFFSTNSHTVTISTEEYNCGWYTVNPKELKVHFYNTQKVWNNEYQNPDFLFDVADYGIVNADKDLLGSAREDKADLAKITVHFYTNTSGNQHWDKQFRLDGSSAGNYTLVANGTLKDSGEDKYDGQYNAPELVGEYYASYVNFRIKARTVTFTTALSGDSDLRVTFDGLSHTLTATLDGGVRVRGGDDQMHLSIDNATKINASSLAYTATITLVGEDVNTGKYIFANGETTTTVDYYIDKYNVVIAFDGTKDSSYSYYYGNVASYNTFRGNMPSVSELFTYTNLPDNAYGHSITHLVKFRFNTAANASGVGFDNGDLTSAFSKNVGDYYFVTVMNEDAEYAEERANYNVTLFVNDGTKYLSVMKGTPSFSTAPIALNPSYTGSALQLLSAAATGPLGSSIEYRAMGEDWLGDWTTDYTEVVATSVKTYYVYYRFAETANWNAVAANETNKIEAKIAASPATLSAHPSKINGLIYSGAAQALANAGTASGGDVYYSLDQSDWSEYIPLGENADTYTVYYKVVGDSDHSDLSDPSWHFDVTIAPYAVVLTITDPSMEYDGTAKNVVAVSYWNVYSTGQVLYSSTPDAFSITYGSNERTNYTGSLYSVNISLTDPNYTIRRPNAEEIEGGAEDYTIDTIADVVNVVRNYRVEKRVLTVAFGDNTFTYDGTAKAPTFTLGNFASSSDADVISAVWDENFGPRIHATRNSTQLMKLDHLTGEGAGNYTLPAGGYVNVYVTINPAEVTIAWSVEGSTFDNDTKVFSVIYDGEDHLPVGVITSTIYTKTGETKADDVSVEVTGALKNFTGAATIYQEPSGLSLVGDDADNYTFKAGESVKMAIERRAITIKSWKVDLNGLNEIVATGNTSFGGNSHVSYAELTYTGTTHTVTPIFGNIVLGETVTPETGGDLSGKNVPGNYYCAWVVSATLKAEGSSYWNYIVEPDAVNKTLFWKILKKDLAVTADSFNVTYGDAAPTYTLTYAQDDFVNAETENTEGVISGTPTFSCSYTKTSAAGYDYPITINEESITSANYNLVLLNGKVSVAKADLTGVKVEQTGTLIYNGTAQTATVKAEATAVNGMTVNFTYSADNENWSASVPTFTDWAENGHLVYYKADATNHNTYGGLFYVFIEAKEVTIAYEGGAKSVTYGDTDAWVALGKEMNDNLCYLTADLGEGDNILDVVSFRLVDGNGTKVEPDDELAVGTYYLVAEGVGNTNYVIVTDNEGKIDLGETATLTVTNATLTDVSVAQTGTLIYNGTAQTATVTAKATAVNDMDVTFTYSATQDGTYTAAVPSYKNWAPAGYTVYYKVTADNHKEETGSFIVTIDKKPVTITIDKKSSVYGNEPVALSATDADEGIVIDDYYKSGEHGEQPLPYTLACEEVTATSNVGNYDITGTGTNPNYNITFMKGEGAYEVTARPITVNYNGTASIVKTYGDASVYQLNPYDYLEIGGDGLVAANDDTIYNVLTVKVSPRDREHPQAINETNFGYAATYYLFVMGGAKAGNYAITNNVMTDDKACLVINPAPLTITADNKSVVYCEATPAFTVTYAGFIGGNYGDSEAKLTGTLDFDCARVLTSGVGFYDITPKGLTADNYDITFVAGRLEVTAADLDVELEIDDTVYGTAVTAPVVDAGITVTGWKNGEKAIDKVQAENIILIYILKDGDKTAQEMLEELSESIGEDEEAQMAFIAAHSAVPTLAGTYYAFVSIDGVANYNGNEAFAEFTIAKKSIIVTAENKSSDYGEALAALTFTTEGIEAGDVVCTASTDADITKTGEYVITLTSTNNPNYTVTLVPGKYTVNAKAGKVETNEAGEKVVEQTEDIKEEIKQAASKESNEGVSIKNMIQNVIEAAADAPIANLEIEVTEEATVAFDKAALQKLAEIADVKITYVETKLEDVAAKAETNSALKKAQLIIEVSLQGASFEGGKATVKTAFENKAPGGKKAVVYYVDEDGNKTDMNAIFEDGFVSFETEHFSTYVVEYVLTAGSIAGIVIGCVVGVAAIAFCLVYFLVIKKKKDGKGGDAAEETAADEATEESTEEAATEEVPAEDAAPEAPAEGDAE